MSFDLLTALGSLAQAGTQIGTGISARSAARDQAREARARGAAEAALERRKGRRLAGKQRALFAKGGVLVSEGTPLDVLAQTAADAEENALRAAFGFEQRAEDFESVGRQVLTRGILGAGATLLGSGETFRDVVNRFKSRSSSSSAPRASVPSGGSVIPRAPGRI